MGLNLTLPHELWNRLSLEAQRRGATVDRLAAELLDRALPVSDKARAAIDLLREWGRQDEIMTEAEGERHRAVLQAIDDDRLSDRRLFDAVLTEQLP
jgi:hypothetical protein